MSCLVPDSQFRIIPGPAVGDGQSNHHRRKFLGSKFSHQLRPPKSLKSLDSSIDNCDSTRMYVNPCLTLNDRCRCGHANTECINPVCSLNGTSTMDAVLALHKDGKTKFTVSPDRDFFSKETLQRDRCFDMNKEITELGKSSPDTLDLGSGEVPKLNFFSNVHSPRNGLHHGNPSNCLQVCLPCGILPECSLNQNCRQ